MASSDVPNGSVPIENKVPEWILARDGIKLIINNKGVEAERLFLQYPDSLVMFAGYSFTVMMDALMSYEEEKLAKAISTLKEVEKRCATDCGWMRQVTQKIFGNSEDKPRKSLTDQLETQIILADSQVCIAILTFLQQDISAYFRGGWVLRKSWKVYEKIYKEVLELYKEHIGELHLPDPYQPSLSPPNIPSSPDWEATTVTANGYTKFSKIPHSKSANLNVLKKNSNRPSPSNCSSPINVPFLKKSISINSGISSESVQHSSWTSRLGSVNSSLSYYSFSSLLSSIHKNDKIEKQAIVRLMGAVSFGYGLFQLGISLLPSSLMRLINILGFRTNREHGIACLMYARRGSDMRAPLAMLSLLWYHTIVRPFYAIDGTNVEAGVDVSTALLRESDEEFSESSLFLFFRGRVCRLSSDMKGALAAYQQAVDNSTQREIRILCMHEMGWCHLIELDYKLAKNTFTYLKSASRWSRAFYTYLAAICAGAAQDIQDYSVFDEMHNVIQSIPNGTQLDEFLTKRSKCCPSDLKELKEKSNIYWKLLVLEMLYLWNALPSCNQESIEKIIKDLEPFKVVIDEPMTGISKLILGCAYCIQGQSELGVESFKKCMKARESIPMNAGDAHISAFCLYELGAMLLKQPDIRSREMCFNKPCLYTRLLDPRIDYEALRVLARESHMTKRLILEMAFISEDNNCIDKKIPTAVDQRKDCPRRTTQSSES